MIAYFAAGLTIVAAMYFVTRDRSREAVTAPQDSSDKNERPSAQKSSAGMPQPGSSGPELAAAEASADKLAATGYVVAQRRAAVSSKATGRLKALNVVEGDVVTEGQVLAVLENDDLSAVVDESIAELEAAKAQVHSAEAELEESKLARERISKLIANRAVSKADFDQADARFKRAAASLELSRAHVRTADSRLTKSRVDLGYTYIRSPFAGTVLTKDADVGEIVAPFGSSTNARAAVVTIADMSSLQVEADISESNIAKVKVGQQCEITLDSYPGKKYRGVVDKIVPTVDRAKATVLAKIRILDRDDRVLPEMSAKINLQLSDESAVQ